jgi:hypothetical protein
MQLDRTQCYICGSHSWLEEHHIFGGANRKLSEKYGLKVMLCHYCHNEPPNGVHHNKENMLKLHQKGQEAFELFYPEEDFMQIFGRNYL